MKMIDMECHVALKTSESIDAYIQSVKESSRKNFDDLFAAEYNGKDFRIKEDQDCLINGKNAHICCVAWDFLTKTR